MITQTLFVRVVPQDRARGYMLLVGFEPKMTQVQCDQYVTLGGVTRDSLNNTIERMRLSYTATAIKDVTTIDIQRKLQKLFGEPMTPLTKKIKVEDEHA